MGIAQLGVNLEKYQENLEPSLMQYMNGKVGNRGERYFDI